jgi:hypothetical protein
MSLDYYAIENYNLEKLKDYGFSKLADLINDLLVSNPWNKEKDPFRRKMYKEQVLINLPILYISSLWTYLYFLENNLKTILFATRDCCHLFKVFKTLFPEVDAHYFHCSRNMFEGATAKENKYYKRYVKEIVKEPKRTLFLDLHGSSIRVTLFFKKEFKEVPHCVQISSRFRDEKDVEETLGSVLNMKKCTSLVYQAAGSPIEMLNYDLVGTLQTYDEEGPLRNRLEYDYDMINVYHKTMDYILEHLRPLNKEDIDCSPDTLRELLIKLFKCILIDKPIISTTMRHIGKHSKVIVLDEDEKNKKEYSTCEKCGALRKV